MEKLIVFRKGVKIGEIHAPKFILALLTPR